MEDQKTHLIALSKLPLIGPIRAKSLLSKFDRPSELFQCSKSDLTELGLGVKIRKRILSGEAMIDAENEMSYLRDNGLDIISILEDGYPFRLKQLIDAPIVLYTSGKSNLNHSRIISVVGTRSCNKWGLHFCNKLIEDISDLEIIVVSGLASGIDSQAHISALNNGLNTIAVVGHGLNYIYPHSNKKLAQRIRNQGMILSDYAINDPIVPGNFIARNRIIAGLSDACLVIQSKTNGGSLLTADFAFSNDRQVLAVPGRPGDPLQSGTNQLIKEQKATLIESAEDLIKAMSWDEALHNKKNVQLDLFEHLDKDEVDILSYILEHQPCHFDQICNGLNREPALINALLMQMEIRGKLHLLPGNRYETAFN